MTNINVTRPALDEAVKAWEDCLSRHGLPRQLLWIFTENLCIEQSPAVPGSLRVGFQIRFTPPDDDALDIAYDYFCETSARLVFYRLGTAAGKSVSLLLCDNWFEERTALNGFERRDDWKISFHPGHPGEIEEISDLSRWVHRLKSDRAFHDFDFGMTLETINEIRSFGRPLLPYERMAQKMLGRLRRMLGQPA